LESPPPGGSLSAALTLILYGPITEKLREIISIHINILNIFFIFSPPIYDIVLNVTI
jgi:hypothetical protein